MLPRFASRLVPALVLVAGAARADGPFGLWETGGARLELVEEQGAVVGRLATAGGGCKVPLGSELLRGTLIDDSLSARVRLCLVAPECGDDPSTALAVLLWTRQLTGGVHTRVACAAGRRVLVMRRPGQGPQPTASLPRAAERLSRVPAPKVPRVPPSLRERPAGPGVVRGMSAAAPSTALDSTPPEQTDEVAVGEVPGRPIGQDQRPGYDVRMARRPGADTAKGLMMRGADQLHEGRFERARDSFRAALVKDPARPEAYNGVGVTYYARGDLDEALAWYKRALEVAPQFGDAYYNMACAYAVKGEKALAFRYLRLAALNHYAERDQLRNDPDLASLRGDRELDEILALMDQGGGEAP